MTMETLFSLSLSLPLCRLGFFVCLFLLRSMSMNESDLFELGRFFVETKEGWHSHTFIMHSPSTMDQIKRCAFSFCLSLKHGNVSQYPISDARRLAPRRACSKLLRINSVEFRRDCGQDVKDEMRRPKVDRSIKKKTTFRFLPDRNRKHVEKKERPKKVVKQIKK